MAKIIKGETRGRPGRWLLDFYDGDGKRRIETYETQKGAKDALAKRLEQLRKGTYRAPDQIPTLREAATAWLLTKQDLRPSSVASVETYVLEHIAPALGDLRLDRVSVADVEQFRENLRREKKLAPRTVNRILATLSAIFKHAARHGHIERNPAAVVERVRLDAGEIQLGDGQATRRTARVTAETVPSAEEVVKLIDGAKEDVYRTFLMTSAYTGAREGELLALTWSDVDLDGLTIAIRRNGSWARTRAEKAAGIKGARFYDPKTYAGRREVTIDAELALALKRWKLACPVSELDLVFPKKDGFPMHRRVLHKQGLLPALTAGKLRHFTVHSLRHFHASALLLAGVPVAEVSARLGHASPAITMSIYTHFLRASESRASDTIAAAMRAARG